MGMSYPTWLVLPVIRLRRGSGSEAESLMLTIGALSIAIRQTGLPHQLTENDIYRGYFMPEDATVMFNTWFVSFSSLSSALAAFNSHLGVKLITHRAITRNEELYPEPERFMPERFWGKMDSEVARQVDAVFGFGRRACPGKAFAESSIFLIMSNIIATMDLTKAVDEAGVPITPPVEYTKSFVR